MFKMNFTFTKTKNMVYISHLDLMRLLTRALRRSGIPLRITQGFNPHPKLSIKRALKLGIESDNEEASILLKDNIGPVQFMETLNANLPEGIEIKSAGISAL